MKNTLQQAQKTIFTFTMGYLFRHILIVQWGQASGNLPTGTQKASNVLCFRTQAFIQYIQQWQKEFNIPQDEQISKLSLVQIIDQDLQELLGKTKYQFMTSVKEELNKIDAKKSASMQELFQNMFVQKFVWPSSYTNN